MLDRYGQRVTVLSKPQRTNRGESLFFDEGGRKSFSVLFVALLFQSYEKIVWETIPLGLKTATSKHDSNRL